MRSISTPPAVPHEMFYYVTLSHNTRPRDPEASSLHSVFIPLVRSRASCVARVKLLVLSMIILGQPSCCLAYIVPQPPEQEAVIPHDERDQEQVDCEGEAWLLDGNARDEEHLPSPVDCEAAAVYDKRKGRHEEPHL